MTLILSGTDNSVSSPAVQGGTGGTTTGVYYPATNQLALATNGTQAVLVDSSQNVGVGTNSPTARLTVVTGSSANNEGTIRVSDNATYYGELKRVNSSDELRLGAYGTAQSLTFYTVASERMRIDSSGNVGIGGTPNTWTIYDRVLQIGSGATLYTYQNTELNLSTNQYYNAGSKYIGTGASGRYQIANTGAHIWYQAASGSAGGAVTYSQALTLNANGALALLGGNSSATGVGIAFPATQSASSDANTLDDYEEGTWTPGLSFGGGTTGITYSTQSGGYIKVGAQVTVWAYILLSSKGSSTGVAKATGLPFTNVNAPGRSEGATASFNYWQNFSGTPIPLGYVQNNATTIYIDNGVGANTTGSIDNTNFNNNTALYFNATYSIV